MSKLSENFKIKFNDRPPNPWQFTQPAPAAISMTWHHIIPFALLNAIWSRLCDLHVDTALPAARATVRQYLLLQNSRLPRVDELVDRMRAKTVQRISLHNPLKPLDAGEILLLQSTVAFPAWDLIEGPRARAENDDPQARFDRFRVGLTPQEARRMQVLEALNDQLLLFLAAPSASTDALSHAMAISAMDLNAVTEPIRFRPEMWLQDVATRTWSKAR